MKIVKSNYPYLVVRLMPAVYQREEITVRPGAPKAHVGHRDCYVQHAAAFESDGSLSQSCKEALVAAVRDAVRRTHFPMCLVWAADSCTLFERDGSVREGVRNRQVAGSDRAVSKVPRCLLTLRSMIQRRLRDPVWAAKYAPLDRAAILAAGPGGDPPARGRRRAALSGQPDFFSSRCSASSWREFFALQPIELAVQIKKQQLSDVYEAGVARDSVSIRQSQRTLDDTAGYINAILVTARAISARTPQKEFLPKCIQYPLES